MKPIIRFFFPSALISDFRVIIFQWLAGTVTQVAFEGFIFDAIGWVLILFGSWNLYYYVKKNTDLNSFVVVAISITTFFSIQVIGFEVIQRFLGNRPFIVR